ncbi:hypothetical protein [Paenibacillus sp. HB172176]|uniref:hypothetical protein n=1 Tax=Paenibacillus sp. HB172176 TaxID=2493690 RepID=UPI0014390934|nr:hypothetical protein [Paenibacillus sp. HB172176]
MIGTILHIPLSIALLLVLIGLIAFFLWQKGRQSLKWLLPVSLPIFILCQLYLWNLDFHHAAKSYLFASSSYHCDYEEDLEDFELELPKRTVLKGKEDACSPFYLTYANRTQFKIHFDNQLQQLKQDAEIQDFDYSGVEETYDIHTGSRYEVELLSGAILRIEYHPDEKPHTISITFQPD